MVPYSFQDKALNACAWAFLFPLTFRRVWLYPSDIFLWKCILYVFQQWIIFTHLLYGISTRLLFILSLFPITQYSSGI